MARIYSGGIVRITGSSDPSTGLGAAAPIGSEYRNTVTGEVFTKTGSGNNAWELAGTGGGGGGGSTFTANPTATTGNEDTPATGNVLDNVSSSTGTLSVLQFMVPSHDGVPTAIYGAGDIATLAGQGSITIAPSGIYVITPLPNYHGQVGPVLVHVSNETEIRTTTLSGTFAAVNDPPVAGSAYALSQAGEAVTIDLLEYASDIEGDAITVTALNGSAPQVGVPVNITDAVMTYQGNGVVQIDPTITDNGEISVTFEVTDAGGLSSTGTITVRVGVDNIPLFSPIAPLVLGDTGDNAQKLFSTTFLQEYGATWPNIGPNNTAVDASYTSARGFFILETSREPWLYDRATTAWLHWKRTGNTDARTAALAWAELYMANVVVSGGHGSFTIDGATLDPKYMYPAIAWWYEQETGLTVYRTKAAALYAGLLFTWPKTYVVGPSLWTERGAAFAILGCLAAHAITGDQQPLDDATEYVDGIIALSTSGAPLHGHDQHEGDSLTTPITSPWMGAFLTESMVQYYRLTEDARVLTWISNYGDWLRAHATYTVDAPDEPEFAGMVGLDLFAYLAGAAGPTDFGQADDMQHARDLQELFRKVKWAKTLLAQDTTATDATITQQGLIGAVDEAYWTRGTPGLAEHRINPPRKFGWKHRNAYSRGIYHVGIVPLAPILVSASSVAGQPYEGSTLTLTPATWNGRPTPDVTYQWYRDSVAIGGETGLTYVTQALDVGTTITARTLASNTGGSAYSESSGIFVLAAGTPQFTLQPTNQTAEVGQTVVFTVATTGTPAPTLQWQRRANSGAGWANVTEGTGGTTDTYTTEALGSGDNGNQVRCLATNVLATVASDTVSIAMIVQQPAAVFTAAQGAQLATTAPQLGDVGLAGFTMTAKVKFSALTNEAGILIADAIAGRLAGMSSRAPAATVIMAVADHLGLVTFTDPPAADTWIDIAIRMPATAGGAIVGSWQLAESSGSVRTAQNMNDVENSLYAQDVRVGAGSNGSGGQAIQAQYIGIYNRVMTDQEIADQRTAPDYTSAYSFWVFYDGGAGALAVRDASGNNRVPTLTGGTLTASGPVAATIP